VAAEKARGTPSPLAATLVAHRRTLLGVGMFSGLINVLALSGSLYMMQVYDRVLPSRSVPTLVVLTGLMAIIYACYCILDIVRIRIMARLGLQIDRALRDRIFEITQILPLRLGRSNESLQPIRDLDNIRGFLSSMGPTALFDLPWIPLFLLLVFALHPWMGLFCLFGAALLMGLTLLTEKRSSEPMRAAAVSMNARMTFAELSRRNAEVIAAMGMGANARARWAALNSKHLADNLQASDAVSGLGSVSRVLRICLQSGMLGLGAYLAVRGEVSSGAIIASSITMSRALAPIELAIAHWRGFVAARQSYERLTELLKQVPAEGNIMPLPRPTRELRVEGLAVGAPGQMQPIIQGVSFALQAGAGLGIIGSSAAGKSTLARALVGAWLPFPRGGTVRLDGATLDQFGAAALGRDVGYLPQDIELFSGTVHENIARLDAKASSESVIWAAQLAGVHDLILQLPDGYNTKVGEGGMALSGGQRQRIALARALYGDPFLVVLDEPNSNLDAIGDFALAQAIRSVRQRGGIAIIVAHRPSGLASVDQLLAMANGKMAAFGAKDDVLQRVVEQANASGAHAAGVNAAGVSGPRTLPGLKVVPEKSA
jgi:PrtD family type I secretion system ABC transporter